VNDAYNANPVSMESALAALLTRAQGARTVAVLGHMAELGADAPRWHAEVGSACAALGIGVVLGVGELARSYATAAAGCEWHFAHSVEQAAELLPGILRDGDVVLLKGSRSAGIERLAELAL
jgi:UDP-N-acetylmuramoyl-tripeptide--D-alanyl-D-alanine ligase